MSQFDIEHVIVAVMYAVEGLIVLAIALALFAGGING
jgi:hypothetical protein